MSIPPYKRVSTDDVTGNWQQDSQLVTGVVGRFMSDTQEAMAGGLQMGTNVTAEYKTVTIMTPATDWTAMALLNSFTSSVATSHGFSAPRWRYAVDGIQLSGAFEYAAGVGAPTLPLQIAQLPAGLVDFNEDSIVWVEGTTVGAVSQSGAGLIRLDATGSLTLRSTEGLAFTTLTFCSLDNVLFAAPLLSKPQMQPPLSCFPVKYLTQLPNGQASDLAVVQAFDKAGPTPVALGNPAWQCDGKGNISILDLKGLALGRTYAVTFRAMP